MTYRKGGIWFIVQTHTLKKGWGGINNYARTTVISHYCPKQMKCIVILKGRDSTFSCDILRLILKFLVDMIWLHIWAIPVLAWTTAALSLCASSEFQAKLTCPCVLMTLMIEISASELGKDSINGTVTFLFLLTVSLQPVYS